MANKWVSSWAADVIKQRVEDYGWDENRLARETGLSFDEVCRIFVGEDYAPEEWLQKVLEALDLEPKDLKDPIEDRFCPPDLDLL